MLLIVLTLSVALPATAASESAQELQYDVTVPAGREAAAAYLRDDDYRTRFTLMTGQSLSITWEGQASGVLLQWYDEKQWYSDDCGATIRLFNKEGKRLSENTYKQLSYRMFLPAEGASRMDIRCAGGTARMISLCEVKVCGPGYEPRNLAGKGPVDLMLILSSVSDELDLMGGLLPLYAGEHGIKTAVVYLGRDDGYQVQAAFQALDDMGLDVIPLFLQREDHMTSNMGRIASYWKENDLRKELASILLTYQPKVVVTCDPNNDSERARTIYTGRLVQDMVKKGIISKTPSIQKLYCLSQNGSTVVDGDLPLAVYGGRTAADVAREAYAQYRTEASYGTVIPVSPRFTLAYTKVGADERLNDLFEHLDTGALIAYQAPTPAPTGIPTPEPTETPTPVPTATETPMPAATEAPTPAATEAPTPAATATPAPTATGTPVETPEAGETEAAEKLALIQRKLGLGKGTLALYGVSGVFVIIALCMVKKRRSTALILLVMAGLLAYVGYSMNQKEAAAKASLEVQTMSPSPEETIAPTPAETQAPTPAPTIRPTPVATSVPTATSAPAATTDPNDQYFRQPGEPEEVVVQDYENGRWEYRSDILSVIIDRVITKENGHPFCKYIAHVRMRGVNCFRPLETSRQPVAVANEPPWRLARNHRAVLAITGDNLNHADVNMKGILIRNGILYSDRAGESTLVIGDDLTMRIYHPQEISGLDLMDSGVTTSYSFGPILVEDGKVNPDADKHRVFKRNPRCGVGMVEPGHFVAIVSDGRDDDRAWGYTLGEFAQIFVDQGAQIAYNLDGGSSAAMVFMGEHINWHSKGTQRTWADALSWGYSRLVPKVTDPLFHYGDGVMH